MSSSVFLSNLDDFITPSQACINPLVSSRLEEAATKDTSTVPGKSARVTLSNDFSVSEFDYGGRTEPDLIKTKVVSSRTVASVSVNDCLACR
jgi:hypothetical protein